MTRSRYMVGLVFLVFFVMSFLTNILGPIVPDIISSFKLSPFAEAAGNALELQQANLVLAARDAYSEGIAALRSSSVDYYSALRNAYYQTRTAEIWERRDAHRAIAGEPPPVTKQ